MARYNLFRCTRCSTLYADSGKPARCEVCTGSSNTTGTSRLGGSTMERLDPDDLGVFPARDLR